MSNRPWILACGLAVACTGTDVGNPPRNELVDFDTPGCKSEAASSKGIEPSTPMSALDARYQGLTCFVWTKLDAQTLRIDVSNYEDGCHADEGWVPRARLGSDGSLDLLIDNPSCASAACGWCVYDLSFQVQVPDMQRALPVHLLGDDCDHGARKEKSAVLELQSGDQGTACGYANRYALDDYAQKTSKTGERNLPCSCGNGEIFCEVAARSGCDERLRCVEVESEHKLCASLCALDADCQLAEGMRCVDGACLLSTSLMLGTRGAASSK